jgi:hypothetical protein
MKKMRYAFSIGLLVTCITLLSQSETKMQIIEKDLLSDYNKILDNNPFNRDQIAEVFYNTFAEKLATEGSIDYPFDSLKNIGSVYSPDKALRIFTWNIPVELNEHLYYGIAIYQSGKTKEYIIVKLNDPVGINQLEKIGEWMGVLYYELILTKHAGQKYYTLLGFSFGNNLSNKKVIDVLSIDDFDELYFCKDLFYYENKKADRIEFVYNEKATMSLRYDQQKKMIVFDHLSPSKPSLVEKYEFYGPDFTYDGFKFEKGIWQHYSNIDITN